MHVDHKFRTGSKALYMDQRWTRYQNYLILMIIYLRATKFNGFVSVI